MYVSLLSLYTFLQSEYPPVSMPIIVDTHLLMYRLPEKSASWQVAPTIARSRCGCAQLPLAVSHDYYVREFYWEMVSFVTSTLKPKSTHPLAIATLAYCRFLK